MNDESDTKIRPHCLLCGEVFSAKRRKNGYTLCLPCGEEESRRTRHTIAPLHKSNYIHVRDPADLIGINLKQR